MSGLAPSVQGHRAPDLPAAEALWCKKDTQENDARVLHCSNCWGTVEGQRLSRLWVQPLT